MTASQTSTIELTRAICAAVIQACKREYGNQLRAIVLTGSMARDEATFRQDKRGWRVLGDAEFLLIFQDRSAVPPSGETRSLAWTIQNDLLRYGRIACAIGLSAANCTYFRTIRPDIFGYELRNCGQVIWGDKTILFEIPAFDATEIPREDGWRLLCNRMIEQLEIAVGLPNDSEQVAECGQYQAVKLYLDMATSLLLFAGHYAPTYLERAEKLRLLASSPGRGWPFPLYPFAAIVANVTHWKIAHPEPDRLFRPGSCDAALRYAIELWRWELVQLTGLGADTSATTLMQVWMRRQPRTQQLRGWAHTLRVEGWLKSWRCWPRWARLATKGSPRYCIYAACEELFRTWFSAEELPQHSKPGQIVKIRALRECLPLQMHDDKLLPLLQEIASQVVFNYKRLLVETRA